jgi:hypothetical protein
MASRATRLNPGPLGAERPMSNLRRWVVIAFVNCFVAIAEISLLELGSGVVPVKPPYLLGPPLLLAVIVAGLVLIGPRGSVKLIGLRVGIGLLVIVVCVGRLFRTNYDDGFETAKRHAEQVASLLTESQRESGSWPDSLADIPPGRISPPPRRYPSVCNAATCSNVAGFFITYRVEAGRPHLVVSRREHGVEWDWRVSAWQVPGA